MMPEIMEQQETYRDNIATVDEQGKRVWIFPKKPSGKLYRARTIVSFVLLAFLFGAPFIRIDGHPFILLNILKRKFIIFGIGFWPQDFHLFVLATISLVVFIVLFTVIFGRVWCGWACPQTIFMEMVFRKIEYLLEGDAHKQRMLARQPMNFNKFVRKAGKHLIFYAIAFIIGNTFLAYIIGTDALFKIITDPPGQHLTGLSAMIIFSGVFYFVFAFFREQACVMVCPYGRLQGVLLDPNSIVVAYDFKRGEPRGNPKKTDGRELGDCIDCHQCVDVCPTGIDIRNGTQLECVNCTACIDACNNIMDRVKKPRGLIRYDSYNGISLGQKLKITPRIIGYSAVLVLLLAILITLLVSRKPIETTILRTPGVLYQETDDGMIANLYNIKIINKTFDPRDISLRLQHEGGRIEMIGGDLHVPEGDMAERAFFIKLPRQHLKFANMPLKISVNSGSEKLEEIKTSFVGPVYKEEHEQ